MGGFACTKLYGIDLTVNNENKDVAVNYPNMKLRPGDCIRWKAIGPADGKTIGINKINFFDTEAESTAAGKTTPKKSTFPIGPDFCTDNTQYCFMYIALKEGTYVYQAIVKHGNDFKIADPELEVTCSGAGCGDPDDVDS